LKCTISQHFSSNKEVHVDNTLIFKLPGVEKNNDYAQMIIQRTSTHTDEPAEVLQAANFYREGKDIA